MLLKAALISLTIFSIGIALGYWLDELRGKQVISGLEGLLLSWSDVNLLSKYLGVFPQTKELCRYALRKNLEFNEELYRWGVEIERMEEVNKFTPPLLSEKKKYVLLKIQFWFNVIELREVCGFNYSTVVYFYEHFAKEKLKEAEQKAQSTALMELKMELGEQIILIALPLNLDLAILELLKAQFNLTTSPSILINEKVKLEGLQSKTNLKKVLEGFRGV